jgi:hypothetical protein
VWLKHAFLLIQSPLPPAGSLKAREALSDDITYDSTISNVDRQVYPIRQQISHTRMFLLLLFILSGMRLSLLVLRPLLAYCIGPR